MASGGLPSSIDNSTRDWLEPEVAREMLFEKILDQLAENSLFSSGLSPTIFVVYAHNNEKEGIAHDECARKLIKWLERIHAQVLSDHSPLLSLVSNNEGTDPIGNILASQICLLPASCHGAETPKVRTVDKAIVCGSQVMENYCHKPSTRAYIDQIVHICTDIAGRPTEATLESTIREHVEKECDREDFHHVLTELAFLEVRSSGLNETHGIVPVMLNSASPNKPPMQYIPVFWNTDVKLKLKSATANSLHRLFFKLLKRLFPDDRDLVQSFIKCYDWVIEDLLMDHLAVVSRERFQETVRRRITKAYQQHWKLFCLVVRDGKLQAYTGKLSDQVSRVLKEVNQSTWRKILKWLSPISASELHGKYHDSGTSRMQGTCDWIIQNEEFRRWYTCGGSSLLSLRGEMGTGKTYCASRVIDWVQQGLSTSDNDEAFAFFYCNKQDKALSEPKQILRNIIRQLASGPWKTLATSNSVHQAVHKLYDKSCVQGITSTFTEWETCLSALLGTYPRTTIVLDGLDECAGLQRQEFVDLLVKHANTDSNTNSIKIFVSSRPEEDIVRNLGEYPAIRMIGAQGAGDVETFVRAKIAEHHRWFKMPKAFQNEVIDTLLDKSGDMFLFASLQIQHLLRCNTHPAMRDRLARLPDSLQKAYEEIYSLATSNHDEKKVLDRAFQWVMCSAKPLTTDELLFAVSQDVESETVVPQRQDLDEELISVLSHNLLSLDNTSDQSSPVWRLAHQAVAEYLESDTCYNYDASHCEAGRLCLMVLLHTFAWSPSSAKSLGDSTDAFKESELPKGFECRCRRETQFSRQRQEDTPSEPDYGPEYLSVSTHKCIKCPIHNNNPLVDYAIYAWPTHVRAQDYHRGQDNTEDRAAGLYRILQQFLGEPLKGSPSYNRWLEHTFDYTFRNNYPPRWSIFRYRAMPDSWKTKAKIEPMSLACYLGLYTIIVKWSESSSFDHSQGHYTRYWEPMWRRRIYLCDQGASLLSWSLVALACVHDETDILKYLLDHGAAFNTKHESEVPPIVAAAMGDSVGATMELLQLGVEMSSPSVRPHMHPIHFAIRNDSLEFVRLLLQQPARLQENEVGEAFASLGYWEISSAKTMTFLLDMELNANTKLKNGSLLTIAAQRGWESLTHRLLQSGTDMNREFEKWVSETNPLEAAVCGSSKTLVCLLIERGAHVTGKAVAAVCRWEMTENGVWNGMLQLLLKSDPDLNQTWLSNDRRTSALIEVVRQGSVDHAQILLKHGADVNLSVEGDCGSALSAVFRKILDRGWNRSDFYPASQMLDALVEAGAELQSLRGDRLDMALAAAAFAGWDDKVQLFLSLGANPNAPSLHMYRTALGAAAASEHSRAPHIVRTLLNNGANVNICFLDDVDDRSRSAALAIDFPLHLMIETRWVFQKPETDRKQHLNTWLASASILVSEGAIWDTNFDQWRTCLQKQEPEFSQLNVEYLDTLGRDIETNVTSVLWALSEAESG